MWEYNYNYLAHHGIKGQRWGVRRFQNKDGTLTEAGKRRRSGSTEERKGLTSGQKKAIVGAAAGVAVVSAAAVYLQKHPEALSSAAEALEKIGNKTLSASKPLAEKGKAFVLKTGTKAKDAAKDTAKGFVRGAAQGAKNAPEKAGKAVAEGLVLGATIKLLEKTLGEEQTQKAIKQYNSFNKKNKINLDPFKAFTKNDEEEDEDD